MDKTEALSALKYIKENSQKRNFTQSFDLIVNLRDIDLKKPENQLDFYVPLPFARGKPIKICALVGPELKEEAKKVCNKVVDVDEFDTYAKDKKATKKLSEEFSYFIAQSNIMPQVAAAFGKVFGPRKKMPNPKAGCVVPPKAALKPLYDRLQKTVRILVKEKPLIQCLVGSEAMKDEEVAENIIILHDQIIHHLPNEQNNIKNIFLKLTMGAPFKFGAKKEELKQEKKRKKKAKEDAEEQKKEN